MVMYQSFVKRFFDIVVSTVALIVLAIPFLVIAAIIRLDSHGPVFFRQQRTGLNGDVFRIYKFRTMKEKAPHEMATSELCNAEQKRSTRLSLPSRVQRLKRSNISLPVKASMT